MGKHLVIHFARFGPYHFTRLRSAAAALEPLGWRVSGLQTAGTDATYAWDETGLDPAALTMVFPHRVYEEIPAAELRKAVIARLDELKPDAMAVAGWGTPDARAALDWCRTNGARAIVMSETRASDGTRRWWKEWIKRRLIRRFDGALVGGRAHKEYLVQLGMPAEKIQIGYDIVDNQHFAAKVAQVRKECGVMHNKRGESARSGPYFLVSSRFIERKNLKRLIDAYTDYRESFQCPVVSVQPEADQEGPWDLVLLGTGDGRDELERYVKEKGIDGVVFAGFQQIDSLPKWYAAAGAFVHPALEEPWGLVINEAMASGLPVLVSNSTGAAELVENGVNGFLFDPRDTDGLSDLLLRAASMSASERRNMGESSQRLLELKAPVSSFGRGLAKLLEDRQS